MSYDLAFWGMWIAAALFFWWFSSRKDATPTDAPLNSMRRDEIIRAYGKVLEQSAHQGRLYMCESDLPFPKQVIREALESGLTENLDQKLREHLEFGLVALEQFLPQEEYEPLKPLNDFLQNLSSDPNLNSELRNLLEKRKRGEPFDSTDKENLLKLAKRLGLRLNVGSEFAK